jgi:hypothetical protein
MKLITFTVCEIKSGLIFNTYFLVYQVKIQVNKREVLSENMTVLRDMWEDTSFQLEYYQTDKSCVQQEQLGLKERLEPPYHVPFESEIVSFVPRGRPESIISRVSYSSFALFGPVVLEKLIQM